MRECGGGNDRLLGAVLCHEGQGPLLLLGDPAQQLGQRLGLLLLQPSHGSWRTGSDIAAGSCQRTDFSRAAAAASIIQRKGYS